MSSRANLIKITGLETAGNELQRSEGSLKKALNVNIDERSVLTPRRGLNNYGNNTGDAPSEALEDKVSQVFEYKNRIFRHYNSSLEFEDENQSFSPISGSFQEIIDGYRIKYQETKGNMYFTTSEGVKKISKESESTINTSVGVNVENAGAPKASDIFATVAPSATGSGFLPPQSKSAYRVLFGKKDVNNNLILGSPSARFVVTNFTEDVSLEETSSVTINDYTQIIEGDYIVINTLNQKYTAYFFLATDTVPQKSDTIGSTYIKVDISAAASNADAAAILANELGVAISQVGIEIDTNNSARVIIKNTEQGDIEDITGSALPASYSVQTLNDGSVTQGTFANCDVTFSIPEGIDTTYFYQLYRTNSITTSDGLVINDIDPGDEMNLVLEEGITEADLVAQEITVLDNIPESFRSQGAFLYTNEVSGEGILQANDQPPVALDVELFNSSLFYANTIAKHRLEATIVSVDDFVNSSTRFIIANKDITRYYTFSGSQQITTIITDGQADTVNGGTIILNSAQNLRKYAIYFDKDNTATPPSIEGRTNIRVDITQSITDVDVAEALETALFNIGDFEVTRTTNEVVITNVDNGESDTIESFPTNVPSADLGPAYDITTDAIGSGEIFNTAEGGDAILSNLASVGQAIDETVRSLVKVINKDNLSPVNAFYLSGSNDLPGKFLLENKTIGSGEFYIALEEPSNNLIGQEITPDTSLVKPIEQIDGLGTTTQITVTGHGYSNGQEVYVGYKQLIGTDPSPFQGKYIVSNVTADTFEIEVATPITVIAFVPAADNTTVFETIVVSDDLKNPNRLYFSKTSEPEAVPITNFIEIGPQDEAIERILALRDNLFVFKTDGVYIVSGFTPADFNVRKIDSTRIIAPDTAVVLNNQIYCLTEQGITVVTDSGVGIISGGIENLIDDVTTETDYRYNSFGVSYENDRAFLMFTPTRDRDVTATQCFRYNIFEGTWTRWTQPATCGVVLERDLKLYLGDGEENVLLQERKNNDRTDYAGKQFDREIIRLGKSESELVTNVNTNIEEADVILQTQLVSNNYFNRRLLVKMDTFETGFTPPVSSTFLDTFGVETGDDIVAALQALNDYLFVLDPVGVTNKSFDNNNFRALTETLVDELNDINSITVLKNYKKPETVTYETYITDVITDVENKVTLAQARPFQRGVVTIFKHIEKEVEWNPQHFGDPSALKQIREATIMFDQNNFNTAVARFFTDVSQGSIRVPFVGKGIGYWSDLPWGDPNAYWGGEGNDIPYRTIVPREKQKCRYLSIAFSHFNAREFFRILGVSGVVRPISSRAYR